MTRLEAVELARQLEELIFITVRGITGPRREIAINNLADALVEATNKDLLRNA